ncbi:AraC family transcriptional regulator [Arenibacter sp. H213]|uniref:Helix-turn-helix domain-containing protein n=1 Tax=Arenibacter antarcticus TaxID=2040469 RepID=A0ABW5VLS8_9FLAO|nr:response regulator transcription factor [Arenibacter sp. H213]MCM4166989.1 AraC family transcriptional regulator [Arenibacter sp. H213]
MKTINIDSNNITNIFNEMQQDLGGSLKSRPQEYHLILDNDLASGTITGVCFKSHICFMQYDITFKEDTLVINNMPSTNPIHFMYCAKGKIAHSFGNEEKQRVLNQFQTGIFSSDPSKETTLFFKKDEHVKISNIMVTTTEEASTEDNIDKLRNQLLKTFMPKNGEQTFAYTGSYNLKIAEQMHQLEAITQKGLVRHLLTQGIVHLMLAMEIQQHKEDQKNSKNNFGSLTKDEVDNIRELAEFVRNYPEIQYNLKYLSSKSGLSPAKLQEGFKLLYNRTVTDYIRNVRVETAEHMIKTTDLNISEIVYSVGLTSRSYFSKIFKERYNCSPKYYQDNQNTLVATA